VKIEKGSVIAANSLVVKSVPENSLVGGVPGKILKSNITWS
jgi:acetyltransferase-like isoleucine patch superfamily enzyme